MRKISWFSTIVILAFPLNQTASAFQNSFVGFWKNIDANTNRITIVDISEIEKRLTIQVWSKCHPRDCDWRREEVTTYSEKSLSGQGVERQVLSAMFKTRFSDALMIIRLVGKDQLEIEVLTRFKGGTISNYRAVYTLIRAQNIRPEYQVQMKLPSSAEFSSSVGLPMYLTDSRRTGHIYKLQDG